MKIGFYPRGAENIDGDVIWPISGGWCDHRTTRPVANPDILFPQIMQAYPHLEGRVLIVDPIRHKDFNQFKRTLPDDVQRHIHAMHTDGHDMKVFSIDEYLRNGEAGSAINDSEEQMNFAVVSPYLLADSLMSPSTMQAKDLYFFHALKSPSLEQYVRESVLTACHEIGHVDYIDDYMNMLAKAEKTGDYSNIDPSVIDEDIAGSTFRSHDNFSKYADMFDAATAELYADAAAARVGRKIIGAEGFADTARMMIDARSMALINSFVTWRLDEEEIVDFRYATSLIWHHALKPGAEKNEQSSREMMIAGAPKLSELQECFDLYGDAVIDSMILHNLHNGVVSPDYMVRRIGEQGQMAQTRLGAVLARDALSAMDRWLPEGVIDPQIMDKAMDQIHQSPGAQKYFADYPGVNPDIDSVAAQLKKWRHRENHHAAPKPEIGQIKKMYPRNRP